MPPRGRGRGGKGGKGSGGSDGRGRGGGRGKRKPKGRGNKFEQWRGQHSHNSPDSDATETMEGAMTEESAEMKFRIENVVSQSGYIPPRSFKTEGDMETYPHTEDRRIVIQPHEANIWGGGGDGAAMKMTFEDAAAKTEVDIWAGLSAESTKRDFSPQSSPLFYKRQKTSESDSSFGIGAMALDTKPATSRLLKVKPMSLESNQVKILLVLKDIENINATDLAKRVGYSTKKEINPSLYHLQRKELVEKVQDMPPVWAITAFGRAQVQAQGLSGDQGEVVIGESIQAANSFWDTAAEATTAKPEMTPKQATEIPMAPAIAFSKGMGRVLGRGILNVEALKTKRPGMEQTPNLEPELEEGMEHEDTDQFQPTVQTTPKEEPGFSFRLPPQRSGNVPRPAAPTSFKLPPSPHDLIHGNNSNTGFSLPQRLPVPPFSHPQAPMSHSTQPLMSLPVQPPQPPAKSPNADDINQPPSLMSLQPQPTVGRGQMMRMALSHRPGSSNLMTKSTPDLQNTGSSIPKPPAALIAQTRPQNTNLLSSSNPDISNSGGSSRPKFPNELIGSNVNVDNFSMPDHSLNAQAQLLSSIEKPQSTGSYNFPSFGGSAMGRGTNQQHSYTQPTNQQPSHMTQQTNQQPSYMAQPTNQQPPSMDIPLNSDTFSALNKNPVSTLNEWAQVRKVQVQYEVIGQSGPAHRKRFHLVAEIDGRRFPMVVCSSKKEGRTEAAEMAIKTLIGEGKFHTPTQPPPMMPPPPVPQMPTNQNPVMAPGSANQMPLPAATGSSLDSLNSETFAALNKNPISALMEWAQIRKMQATIETIGQTGPSHKPQFRMQVTIGGRLFPPVVVSNKKDGRKDAAEMALKTLMAEGSYTIQQETSVPRLPAGRSATHFDKMAALSHQKFNQLLSTVPESMAGRKILAAMVMKKNPQDEGVVVSVGTGNRCITGPYMSLEGSTVNDSHAEIITRRGLVRLMYKNLLEHQPGSPASLFVPSERNKCRLRDGISFHLYISTAPCGDGALFSPRDAGNNSCDVNEDDKTHNPTFTSKVQGVLRTKMEGGEGTIPVEDDFTVQTFDGIMRGERLRTMSCSDKICRWNALGMQGALLSHFVEPVYLESLTLGLLYDHGHLSRAVCCRLDHNTELAAGLPPGYRVNHPHLGRVTLYDGARETQKTKEHSINWCMDDPAAELTDGTKGLVIDKASPYAPSRVCKKYLYASFKQLCQKYSRQELLAAETYADAKKMAVVFQHAKSMMVKKFRKVGYSQWVEKPVEEGMFS